MENALVQAPKDYPGYAGLVSAVISPRVTRCAPEQPAQLRWAQLLFQQSIYNR